MYFHILFYQLNYSFGKFSSTDLNMDLQMFKSIKHISNLLKHGFHNLKYLFYVNFQKKTIRNVNFYQDIYIFI